MRRRLVVPALLLSCGAALLAGCGQKGPLFLPTKAAAPAAGSQPAPPASAAPPAPASTSADSTAPASTAALPAAAASGGR